MDEVLAQAYRSSLNMAADQTGLADSTFPAELDIGFDQIMHQPIEWEQD